MRVSVDKYFENIAKIILWKNFHDRIHNQTAVMLFSLFLVTFPNKFLYLCVYSVFDGLTMAAPVGHLTLKFNSIKSNSLGLLPEVRIIF